MSKEVWKQIGIDIIAKLLAQHTGDGKYRKVDLTYCDVVDTVDDGSIIEGGNVTVGDTVDDGNIDTVDEDDDGNIHVDVVHDCYMGDTVDDGNIGVYCG